MNLEFHNYHPHKFIKDLAKQLGISSRDDCLEEIINLSGKLGTGKITGFLFSDGVSFLVFDCMLEQDWNLTFVNDSPAPLLFSFDIEGEVWHSFNNGDIRYHLNPLQGSITACPKDSMQTIKLPGRRQLLFTALLIRRSSYLKKIDCIVDKMPDKLSGIFRDEKAEKPFFYQGNYSIAASECIWKIANDKHDGLVRSTYLEAKALELLSRQIKQFKDDLLSPGKQLMLRKFDIDKIKKAKEILISNLQKPPTIEQLSKLAGINQQKLKKGFKAIYESTINTYLNNERLERASILLLQEHSVKEASLEVGYANQSHFAKKFKAKYGVLPKAYLKSMRLKSTVSQ